MVEALKLFSDVWTYPIPHGANSEQLVRRSRLPTNSRSARLLFAISTASFRELDAGSERRSQSKIDRWASAVALECLVVSRLTASDSSCGDLRLAQPGECSRSRGTTGHSPA